MALLEKHRSVIYAHLVEHVGEEAAEAMLAQFPSRDLDEPVTKEFVALQIAQLRTEMAERFAVTDSKIGDVRTEMAEGIGGLRAEMHGQTERVLHCLHVTAGLQIVALSIVAVLLR